MASFLRPWTKPIHRLNDAKEERGDRNKDWERWWRTRDAHTMQALKIESLSSYLLHKFFYSSCLCNFCWESEYILCYPVYTICICIWYTKFLYLSLSNRSNPLRHTLLYTPNSISFTWFLWISIFEYQKPKKKRPNLNDG